MNIAIKTRTTEEESKYPYLGINDGLIILFARPGKGTVLQANALSMPVGISSINWDESNFEPFDDYVILSNRA